MVIVERRGAAPLKLLCIALSGSVSTGVGRFLFLRPAATTKGETLKLSAALDYFLEIRAAALSQSTQGYYKTAINRLIAVVKDIRHKEVHSGHIGAFIKDLTQQKERWRNCRHRPPAPGGLSKFTIARMIQAVKSFFEWFVKKAPQHRLKVSPADGVEYRDPGTAPLKHITASEIKDLLSAATHPRDYALIRFALATGARRGGLQGMKVGDLELGERAAVLTEKGDKTRTVYFDHETRDAIMRWLRVRPQTTDALWAKDDGEPLTLAGLRQVLLRLCRKAGLRTISLHMLRHTFCYFSLKRKVPIPHIQSQMGHRDPKTTLGYANQVDADRQEYYSDSLYEEMDRRPLKEQFKLVK